MKQKEANLMAGNPVAFRTLSACAVFYLHLCMFAQLALFFPLADLFKGVIPQTVSVKHQLSCKTETQPLLMKKKRKNSYPSVCQQDMSIPSIVFIALQLPNMFLPFTGLWQSKQESLLSASPSSLMPMLCLHLKHSPSPHNQRWFFTVHITKKLPQ